VLADESDGVVLRFEWGCASEEVVGRGGQRILVGAAVEFLAHELLGCGVGESAQGSVRRGESVGVGGVGKWSGDAEVGEVHPAAPGAVGIRQHDVGGFDVAVHQAPVVGVVQRVGDGGDDGGGFLDGHAGRVAIAQQLSGVGTCDVLGGDPQLVVVVTAVVHGDDMRMGQRGGEVGFAFEPLPEILVVGNVGMKHLERILARKAGMLSQIDLAHAAGAQ
jgi:hypothetical protein